MEKIEYRAVIKFLFLKGYKPTQIKEELDAVYGDSAPSFTTVKFWSAEFTRGRTNLGDEERSRRPKTSTTDDNIAQVHQMVLDNRRIKAREIEKATNMSKERVCRILKRNLGKSESKDSPEKEKCDPPPKVKKASPKSTENGSK